MKTCLLAATALQLAAGPLQAQPPINDGRTATVRVSDLDLAHAEGRAMLARRLRGAAHHVCRVTNAGPLGWVSAARCRRETLAAARPDLTAALDRGRPLRLAAEPARR